MSARETFGRICNPVTCNFAFFTTLLVIIGGFVIMETHGQISCSDYLMYFLVFCFAIVGLLLHHYWIHNDPDMQAPAGVTMINDTWCMSTYIQNSRERWFQVQEMTNSHSHESWVVMFASCTVVTLCMLFFKHAFNQC